MKLGILGTGNMAEALIAGLLAKKTLRPGHITGFDVDRKRAAFIRKRYKIRTARSVREVLKKSDVLLVAVKPQQMKDLLREMVTNLSRRHLVISIAAGIDTKFLKKNLGPGARIVRVMPNTPALVGLGASAYFLARGCRPSDRKAVETLLSAVGEVHEVGRETLLDAVTGLSGSGPAFVYLFLDGLIEGGKRCGLSETLARDLATQTVLGTATLFGKSGLKPEELISKVASKGGTTEAGLVHLGGKGFRRIVEECVRIATRRAEEMKRDQD